MTRSGLMIACVALAGCSRERTAGNDIDLNLAAAQAEDDIANYAAGRRPAVRQSSTRPVDRAAASTAR